MFIYQCRRRHAAPSLSSAFRLNSDPTLRAGTDEFVFDRNAGWLVARGLWEADNNNDSISALNGGDLFLIKSDR